MITHCLNKIASRQDLSREEAAGLLEELIAGRMSKSQAAGWLMGLRVKGETVEEILGLIDTMERHMVKVSLADSEAIDVCGTGGDGAHTFNVSTAAAIVIAAGGVTVAKHGNRSVSSKCGSADVLEALGVKIDLTPQQSKLCVDETGIGFFFAPLYHPAMKAVAPIRQNLAVRTVFNMIGPLLNPAGVRRQLIGAFSVPAARILAEVVKARNYRKACTVHSFDGFDEISPFAPNHIFEVVRQKSAVAEERFAFAEKNGDYVPESIRGESAGQNASIILSVLQGENGCARKMVLANAAFGFYVAEKTATVEEGLRLAAELIDHGAALRKLEQFRKFTRQVPVIN